MSYHGGQDRRITGFNPIILQDLARGIQASPGQLGGLFRFLRISVVFHCSSG